MALHPQLYCLWKDTQSFELLCCEGDTQPHEHDDNDDDDDMTCYCCCVFFHLLLLLAVNIFCGDVMLRGSRSSRWGLRCGPAPCLLLKCVAHGLLAAGGRRRSVWTCTQRAVCVSTCWRVCSQCSARVRSCVLNKMNYSVALGYFQHIIGSKNTNPTVGYKWTHAHLTVALT